MKLINKEIKFLNHEMESQSKEIRSIKQKMKSQSKDIKSINQEMESQSTKIESLVLENKEMKDTILQMNVTLSKILDFCKFYSSITYFFT